MTPANALTNYESTSKSPIKLFVTPLLQRIKKESAEEYTEMQEAFSLLGWAKLPDELKIEIYEDVKFMVQELKGMFCTNDPYVEQRRNSIYFWVNSFQDEVCTLKAAVNALKIKPL